MFFKPYLLLWMSWNEHWQVIKQACSHVDIWQAISICSHPESITNKLRLKFCFMLDLIMRMILNLALSHCIVSTNSVFLFYFAFLQVILIFHLIYFKLKFLPFLQIV